MNILVVDDSKAMRMIVIRALRQAGFRTDNFLEAGNGTEALKSIEATPPDLVLTDWDMPEMTGLELLKAVKDRGLKVKIGMVTSQGTTEMREQARDAGALFLLAKPFDADKFRETLYPILQ